MAFILYYITITVGLLRDVTIQLYLSNVLVLFICYRPETICCYQMLGDKVSIIDHDHAMVISGQSLVSL